jgi:geranylgeranyl diphosphate synthase type II
MSKERLLKNAALVERFLSDYFSESEAVLALAHVQKQSFQSAADTPAPPPHSISNLLQSTRYSLLQPGGKRFRPGLAIMTAEALGHSVERVLPFAAAVECIHTYSLIHDDLPVMDNDDMRRGQPTNHKVYGDATALLAGDALLTEAFRMLATAYAKEPQLAIQAVGELARAAGIYGMVGGQAIDMNSKSEEITVEELESMHRLKTGALIAVAASGAARLCGATPAQQEQITVYAENLGLAFQVADDILDYLPEKPEPGSYPALLGLEKTRAYLEELSKQCEASLQSWSSAAEPLRELAKFNTLRVY